MRLGNLGGIPYLIQRPLVELDKRLSSQEDQQARIISTTGAPNLTGGIVNLEHAWQHASSSNVLPSHADTGRDPIGPYNYLWSGSHVWAPARDTTPVTIKGFANTANPILRVQRSDATDWLLVSKDGLVGVNTANPVSHLTIKDTGLDPLTLSPWAWWKADSISASNGANLDGTTWTDSSGNGRNLTLHQFGGGTVTFVTPDQNGKPAVKFVGQASSTLGAGVGPGTNFTIIIAYKEGAAVGVTAVGMPFANDNSGISYLQRQWGPSSGANGGGTDTSWTIAYGAAVDYVYNVGAFGVGLGVYNPLVHHVFSIKKSGNAHTGWFDGTLKTSGTVNLAGTPSWYYCFGNNGTDTWQDRYILEALVFSSALSDSDRQNVEAYLNSKYNLNGGGLASTQYDYLDCRDISGNIPFIVKKDGKVGVGTELLGLPAVKLDVMGDVRITPPAAFPGTSTLIEWFSDAGGPPNSYLRYTPGGISGGVAKISIGSTVYGFWIEGHSPTDNSGDAVIKFTTDADYTNADVFHIESGAGTGQYMVMNNLGAIAFGHTINLAPQAGFRASILNDADAAGTADTFTAGGFLGAEQYNNAAAKNSGFIIKGATGLSTNSIATVTTGSFPDHFIGMQGAVGSNAEATAVSTKELAAIHGVFSVNVNALNSLDPGSSKLAQGNWKRVSSLRGCQVSRPSTMAGTNFPAILSGVFAPISYYGAENWGVEIGSEPAAASSGSLVVGAIKIPAIGGGSSAASGASRRTQAYFVPWTSGQGPTGNVKGDVFFDDGVWVGPPGLIENDGTSAYRVRQIYGTGSTSTTVGNTGTETTLLGTVVGTYTTPANTAVIGRTYRVRMWGYYSTKAAAPGTIEIKVKWGTTTIGTTGAQTAPNNETNKLWRLEFDFTIRTTGATGTCLGQGNVELDAGIANLDDFPIVNTATTTIDTSVNKALDVTVTWGTADPSNTITRTNDEYEVMN